MEITIRGLTTEKAEEAKKELRDNSVDVWEFENDKNYIALNFFCRGICILETTIMVMIADFGLIHLEIPLTEYRDIKCM